MRVIRAERSSLTHPTESGCRVLLDWPDLELYQKEHEIPRVRVPIEVRPPVAYPRLMVSVIKPNGEYSERRASIDSWGDTKKAVLIIRTSGDELIPLDSDVNLLRYEI